MVLPKKHPSRVAPISGKSTHEAWCIAGAQEQGPASVTVGPLREGKRVRTAVRAGAGCTADPRPPLPREGQLRAACRSAWVAPGGVSGMLGGAALDGVAPQPRDSEGRRFRPTPCSCLRLDQAAHSGGLEIGNL